MEHDAVTVTEWLCLYTCLYYCLTASLKFVEKKPQTITPDTSQVLLQCHYLHTYYSYKFKFKLNTND